MSTSLRQAEILSLARGGGKVVVEDLARHFGVTLQTVRRDLGVLCDSGQLTRVYGGAVLRSGVANIGYAERRALAAEEKEAIGRACAAAIPHAASLFLNIGTTTEAVARALLNHRDLLVVTNNLNVANILADNDSAEVIVAGGVLRRADGGLVGDMTLDMVKHFKVDIAVIGASALDSAGDLLDYDLREVRVSREIIRSARRTFLVADHSKFARSAPVRIASLADVDTFFTDAPLSAGQALVCQRLETRVVAAMPR